MQRQEVPTGYRHKKLNENEWNFIQLSIYRNILLIDEGTA
jgi:hypothetical protein